MTALAFFVALSLAPAQQTPAQTPPSTEPVWYENSRMELRFSHPPTWQVTTNKKGETRILMPVENSKELALLEIMPVNFRSETSVWQLSQVGITKTLNQEIERQWEEEILGVPLLLTKVNFSERSGPRTSLIGLLYTLSPAKLMYRLTTNPEDFDKANFEWRQVMQSLRTSSGAMPKPEDPSIKIDPKDPRKDELAHPTIPRKIDQVVLPTPIKAPVAATADVAGRKVELRVPAGWTTTAGEKPGTFTLRGPGVSEPVSVEIHSTLDSDPPSSALIKLSAVSLNEYVKVNSREEKLPKPNKAGAAAVQVWRVGTSSKGPMMTCEAVGHSGDFYFLLSYRTENAAQFSELRRAIATLVDQMSVELVP